MRYQNKALNGTFNKRLDAAQCLDTYLSAFSNRSDVLLVSTVDLLYPQQASIPNNNSLLFIGNTTGLLGPGSYWQCGSTNTFDSRKPALWAKNSSIIQDWNIIGYKIDYCVMSETPVEDFCGLKFSPFIIIGMLFKA